MSGQKKRPDERNGASGANTGPLRSTMTDAPSVTAGLTANAVISTATTLTDGPAEERRGGTTAPAGQHGEDRRDRDQGEQPEAQILEALVGLAVAGHRHAPAARVTSRRG